MSREEAGEPFIQYMRLDGIRRDPGNPKDHDLGALGEAFRRFGYVMPMALNEATGLLLAGHGRLDELEMLQSQGEPKPERIRVDEADGMWMAPVIRGISMSPDDGRAYLLADNRLVELGGWLEPALAERLFEAARAGSVGGLRGTGFDERDLEALIATLSGPAEFPAHGPSDPMTEAEAAAASWAGIAVVCPKCGELFKLAGARPAAEASGEA